MPGRREWVLRPDGDGARRLYRPDMDIRSEVGTGAAVIVPDARSLGTLTVAPGLHPTPATGDDLGAFLRDRVERPGDRCVVAVDAHRIVGYLVAVSPLAGDRFSGIGPVLELLAVDVVEPHRGQGILGKMFRAAFRSDLDELILFAVADPALRRRHESVRGFRDRMLAVFGSVGFFPYPTDYPAASMHRDALFLVRVGRGVPKRDAEAFVDELQGGPRSDHVAVHLADPDLRNLVRTDLERSGFVVEGVAARPRSPGDVDALVTEFDTNGAPVVVRIVDDERLTFSDMEVRVPESQLDRLPGIVRAEIARRRYTRWPRSSPSAT